MSTKNDKDGSRTASMSANDEQVLTTVGMAAKKLGIEAMYRQKSPTPAKVYYSTEKSAWIAEVFRVRFARPDLCEVVKVARSHVLRSVEGLGGYCEGGLEQFLLDNPGVITATLLAVLDLEAQHHEAHAAEARFNADLAKGNLC